MVVLGSFEVGQGLEERQPTTSEDAVVADLVVVSEVKAFLDDLTISKEGTLELFGKALPLLSMTC